MTLFSQNIFPELEGIHPEDLEGIDALLERARRRVARHSSTAGSLPSYQSSLAPTSLRSIQSDQPQGARPSIRRAVSLAPRSPRVRKVSAGLSSYDEAPEAQHLMERPNAKEGGRDAFNEEAADDESRL